MTPIRLTLKKKSWDAMWYQPKTLTFFQRCEKYWLDALTSVRGHKWTCRKKAVLQLSYSAFFLCIHYLPTKEGFCCEMYFFRSCSFPPPPTVWKLQKLTLVFFFAKISWKQWFLLTKLLKRWFDGKFFRY